MAHRDLRKNKTNPTTMTTATTIIKDSYRGWTIAEDDDQIKELGKLICYPKEQGISHDYDYTGDGHRYCGNCLWFNDLAEAEAGIDDHIIMEQEKEISAFKELMSVKDTLISSKTDKLKIAVQCIEACKEEFIYRFNNHAPGALRDVLRAQIDLCNNALKAIQE